MLTLNEGGTRKIFIISSTTGKLLLESTGTWPRDYSNFLNRTENMLSAHVAAIRAGEGPVREEAVDVVSIKQEIEDLTREMKATKLENEKLQGELGVWKTEVVDWKRGVEAWKREVEGWKRENEDLRRQLRVAESPRENRPCTDAVGSESGDAVDTPCGTEFFGSEAG
ncbi:hypothetical protein BDD12DRAFT_939553 [Trichophaea hybrida]|nr:hypothetical protein BDD12DRAFT_939553 [Trichophaea hybrida]